MVRAGVVEYKATKPTRPLPFGPCSSTYPAKCNDLIKAARVLCLPLLYGVHLIHNAITLSQFENTAMGKAARVTLSLLCDLVGGIDRTKMANKDLPKVVSVLEVLQAEGSEEKDQLSLGRTVAGYRVWFYINDDSFDIFKRLKDIFENNNQPMLRGAVPCDHRSIDGWDSYNQLVGYKNGSMAKVDLINRIKADEKNVLPNCALSPWIVFNTANAMHAELGVSEMQCNVACYNVSFGGDVNKIGFTERSIQLTDRESTYETLLQLQLPTFQSLQTPNSEHHPEWTTWEKFFGKERKIAGTIDNSVDDFEDTFRAIYGASSSFSTTPEDINRILTAKRKEAVTEFKQDCKVMSPDKATLVFQEKVEKIQMEGLDMARPLFNRNGTGSIYQRKALAFIDDYLKEHNNTMYNPIDTTTTNLSSSDEFILLFLHDMQCAYATAMSHLSTLRGYLTMHSSLDNCRTDKLHYLIIGGPAFSKSRGLDVDIDFSVPGTAESLTYSSLKSDAIGENFDGRTNVYHETPYAMIGVQSGKTHSMTEQEAMAKQAMTSGFVRARVMCNDKERTQQDILSLTNNAFAMAGNFKEKDISQAFLSRVFLDSAQPINCPGRNINDLMCAPIVHGIQVIQDRAVRRYQWMHAMQYLLNMLIACGILLEAKTSYTNCILPEFVNKCKSRGITRAEARPRATKRLQAAVRIITKIDAVRKVFCDELSPLKGERNPDGTYKGKPFSLHQMVLCQPFMIDDPSKFVSMLGLYAADFDDKDHFTVLSSLKAAHLHGNAFRPIAGKTPKHTRSNGYEELENLWPPTTPDAAKKSFLANAWRPHMNPKLEINDVVEYIEKMAATYIDVSDGKTSTPTCMFELTQTGFKILQSCMDDNTADGLENTLKSVMQYDCSREASYLFSADYVNLEPCDMKVIRMIPEPLIQLKLNNLNYYVPERLEILRAGSIDSDMADIYEKTPFREVRKIPLEDHLRLEFYAEIGWGEAKLQQCNAMAEHLRKQRLIEINKENHTAYKAREAEAKRLNLPEAKFKQMCGPKPIALVKFDPASLKEKRIALPAPPANSAPPQPLYELTHPQMAKQLAHPPSRKRKHV
jgi:hypothetical protein